MIFSDRLASLIEESTRVNSKFCVQSFHGHWLYQLERIRTWTSVLSQIFLKSQGESTNKIG